MEQQSKSIAVNAKAKCKSTDTFYIVYDNVFIFILYSKES